MTLSGGGRKIDKAKYTRFISTTDDVAARRRFAAAAAAVLNYMRLPSSYLEETVLF